MLKSIACVLALAAAVPAAADTRVVRYDDLNLSSRAGIERLERRIENAARHVCGVPLSYRQSLHEQAASKPCVDDAKARAMTQVARLAPGAVRGG